MRTDRKAGLWLCLGVALLAGKNAKADEIDFVADITSACAASTSTATGFGTFSLNTQTGQFTWHIEHTLEEAIFAHIHGPIAQACGSGGGGLIVVHLGLLSPMIGSTVFNETKQQEVLNDLYYVNIHTDLFVTGEIAGVIVRAPEIDKCRHISFVPGNPGANTAIRVTLTSLHHVDPPYTGGPSIPFTSFEGEVRWVGPPTQYVESTASGTTFHSSTLQCTPHYQDWGSILRLHVNGSAIVPSSIYDVDVLAESCMGNEAGCGDILDSYTIGTSRWGDVESLFNPPSETVQPDVTDISSLVNKYRSAPGAPIKARALLSGSVPFGVVDPLVDLSFSHISACVDAFRGLPYPHTIESCP